MLDLIEWPIILQVCLFQWLTIRCNNLTLTFWLQDQSTHMFRCILISNTKTQFKIFNKIFFKQEHNNKCFETNNKNSFVNNKIWWDNKKNFSNKGKEKNKDSFKLKEINKDWLSSRDKMNYDSSNRSFRLWDKCFSRFLSKSILMIRSISRCKDLPKL